MPDNIAPPSRPIAEIEAENRKQMVAVREKEKEKEKAEEDQQFVIDMAVLECKLCTNPVGMLKVNFDTPTIQNKKTATVKEKDSKSLIFMGTCTKSPNASAPCVGVMQLGEWKDVGTSLVQDQKPLIKKSTIMCNYGGSTITITKSGQINVPSIIDKVNPKDAETKPYKCTHCEEEITLEQIKYITTGKKDGKISDESKVIEIIGLLNKYRKDFKLDTCLRKAHFISQVGAESKFKSTYEGSSYSSTGLTIFNSKKATRFRDNQEIDDTVLNSLKENLNSIFKILNAEDKVITKTNDELKTILKAQKVVIDEKELYGKYKGEKDSKDKKKYNDKLIKEVLTADKKVDFKIYLKIHAAFGMQILSRAYADRGGNDNELSRDGWKFRGKGIKQVTFKDNYINFAKFRKKNPFTGDTTGEVDFTTTTDNANLKGNFDKLADDTLYGVQSAIWYWIEGNGSVYANADNDNVKKLTEAINGGLNGLENRDKYTKLARQEDGFKVFKHYKLKHENGTKEEKESVITSLKYLLEERKVKDSASKKLINLKDDNAQSLLDELDPKKDAKDDKKEKEVVKKK
jgi:predicted chitinase